MRKKLALVLLMESCPPWPSPGAADSPPSWTTMPSTVLFPWPWTLALGFTEAWTRLLLELMSWTVPPVDPDEEGAEG